MSRLERLMRLEDAKVLLEDAIERMQLLESVLSELEEDYEVDLPLNAVTWIETLESFLKAVEMSVITAAHADWNALDKLELSTVYGQVVEERR